MKTTLQELKEIVEKEFKIPALEEKTRKLNVVIARCVFYSFGQKQGFTLKEMGEATNQHNATVYCSIHKLDNYIFNDKSLKEKIISIESQYTIKKQSIRRFYIDRFLEDITPHERDYVLGRLKNVPRLF